MGMQFGMAGSWLVCVCASATHCLELLHARAPAWAHAASQPSFQRSAPDTRPTSAPLALGPLQPRLPPCPQVASIPAEDFVYMSFANAALGATPYIIALHRWARAPAGRCVPCLWGTACSAGQPFAHS